MNLRYVPGYVAIPACLGIYFGFHTKMLLKNLNQIKFLPGGYSCAFMFL